MNNTIERDIYTPSRLNREVRLHLESGFSQLWVEGEVSNLARPSSGHLYFTLKDDRAQIRCALFRNRNPYGRTRLENGQQIVVGGRLSLYEPRGEYQLIADHVEDSGEGRLRRELEALKKKLAAEGLFDAERKRPLPRFPRTIAVVTSPSGAAIRDIISVVERRYRLVRLVVVPSVVQGDQAPSELRAALARAQALSPDVILLTRGGGSLEDLWAFNDEGLARDIAASPVPTACAVGHEVDFSIAEFVADQRAATPSAAAELLVPDARELLQTLRKSERALQQCINRGREHLEQRFDRAVLRLNAAGPGRRLVEIRNRMNELGQRNRKVILAELRHLRTGLRGLTRRLLASDPRRKLAETHQRCLGLERRLTQGGLRQLESARLRLEATSKTLRSVSPQRVLERGYSVTLQAAGRVVRSSDDVRTGDTVTTRLASGQLESEVKKTI